jgi:hypothetical protein
MVVVVIFVREHFSLVLAYQLGISFVLFFFFIKGLNDISVILGLMFFLGLEPKLVSLPSINVLVYGFKKRVTVRERGD